MQEIVHEALRAGGQVGESAVVSLVDMPVARLQIVQASDKVMTSWLDRSLLEPQLTQNADGLWILAVRQQGEYGTFDKTYIGSHIILADGELGLVVVLMAYHGVEPEKYGKRGYLVQKGQFYRYYRQEAAGNWRAVAWRLLNDEVRQRIISAVEASGPVWARTPGKLQAQRKPPTRPVVMISYKVVRVIDGRYFSLYDPSMEYVLGKRVKQQARPHHGGGWFSYSSVEEGMEFLSRCVEGIPFHEEVETPLVALLECEISGRIIDYGHKLASTYLCPLRVLEVRPVE